MDYQQQYEALCRNGVTSTHSEDQRSRQFARSPVKKQLSHFSNTLKSNQKNQRSSQALGQASN